MEDKILEIAGELFLTLGFKSVTMDDIASKMGISKKTLYKYFSNKITLINATTASFQNSIEKAISFVKSQNYNAIEEEFAVKAIFDEMFKNAKDSPMFQLKKYYPETYGLLMERELRMFRECNIDNLTKGIDQKLYRSDIKKEVVSGFFFTIIHQVFESDSFLNMQEIIKAEYEVLEYHIRAIATEKGIKELEKQLEIINKK
ncbi:TetR/AcrR family transcriptional regulator [Tenacibaculum sp. C7A-26P2]|uniref:TetR/AcrR family transcriptional regulator n=1 Tax=Tenacibaculum sp. C7A-26P2 TaxID=3447504 RepID=UPI003F835177